jgi:hypothetical protein
MKVMDSLAEMRTHLPEGACRCMMEVVEGLFDYIEGPIEHASFTELLGGPAYLIERVEELAAVRSTDEFDGRRLSLAESASAAFDIAGWVGDGAFARFCVIEGSDGGPQYFIPRPIADEATTVADSIVQPGAARE